MRYIYYRKQEVQNMNIHYYHKTKTARKKQNINFLVLRLQNKTKNNVNNKKLIYKNSAP